MDKESIKLGKITPKVQKALGMEFGKGSEVYAGEAELSSLAKDHPDSYLKRVEESSKIIAHPDYALYDGEGKVLFLMRDYYHSGAFKKVVVQLKKEEAFHLSKIDVLSANLLKEIVSKGTPKRVNR